MLRSTQRRSAHDTLTLVAASWRSAARARGNAALPRYAMIREKTCCVVGIDHEDDLELFSIYASGNLRRHRPPFAITSSLQLCSPLNGRIRSLSADSTFLSFCVLRLRGSCSSSSLQYPAHPQIPTQPRNQPESNQPESVHKTPNKLSPYPPPYSPPETPPNPSAP